MIIQCPSCQSKYQYDEDRFERKRSKKIRCAKCQTVFEIHNPAFSEPEPAAADSTAARAARNDETRTTRKPPAPQESTEQAPIPKSNTDQRALELNMPEGKRLSLAIIDGKDAGSVFRIEKTRVVIGRTTGDLVINDTEASRQHAAIEIRDTIFLLRDLDSTNGTLVNGVRITDPVEIHDKSEFQIGNSTIMLIVTDDH